MKSTKNLIFAFATIISLSFVFVSCGSDGDSYTEASTFVTSIDTLTLTGLKSQTNGGSTSYTVSFSNHLPSDVFGNLIKSKTTFQNSDCGIGVFGLTALGDTAKISNLKITIGSTSYTLGTCYADDLGTLTPDIYESSDTYLAIAKAYFNAILSGSGYKTTVTVSLTTNVNIVESNKITLRIKYYAKDYYKDYYKDYSD